ncbi:MAG: inositol monophosphatase [Lentisphaerae bacterium]|nr:inositol monophosphatase [Lentisphaerota bacterium]
MNPAPDPAPEALLACAVEAARAGGMHALQNRARRTEYISVSRHDIKLRLDVESQAAVEAVIRSRFPSHAVLGEEDAAPAPAPTGPGPAGFEWVVDPIDGTINFSHGLPLWNTSVAVRRGGAVLAGAVFVPAFDHLYTATAGGPAELNGSSIRVSATDALERAVVCTGLDKNTEPAGRSYRYLEAIASAAQRPRVTGSAALDLCFVASGCADGYFESGIYTWDIAAAGLIVSRAGGRTEVLARLGGERLSFLATNGRIHGALKTLLTGPNC